MRRKFLLGFLFFTALLLITKKGLLNLDLPQFNLNFQKTEEIVFPIPSPKAAEKLFRELQLSDLEPLKFKQENEKVEVTLEGGIMCVFTLGKPVSPQVASLQMIINRFKIEGKKPKEVDLRFEKPIVKF